MRSIRLLMLILLSACLAPAAAAKDDPLIAIDVLLLPDAAMAARAAAMNARLRTAHPAGYALDETHAAHITLVQRYVRESDLPAIEAAVARASKRAGALPLTATGYVAGAAGDLGLLMLGVESSSALIALKDNMVAAVQPFAATGGTEAAFVREAGEPIARQTIDWVETFVPAASGATFFPHITIGVAPMPLLREIAAEPAPPPAFTAPVVAIYRLGNFGTARTALWRSDGR